MNLDNFSEKLRITVDAAFNYAKENNFRYFFPIHILIILLQNNNLISPEYNYAYFLNSSNIFLS